MKSKEFLERKNLLANRPAARHISDIALKEDIYKPDFEVGDRYFSFSTEIIRLSLLGIAGYGFIISEILMRVKDSGSNEFKLNIFYVSVIIIGILFLGLALGFSLYHRFKCTSCLLDQILIARSLLRLKNDHWSKVEKNEELIVLEKVRCYQKIEAKRHQNILGWSSFLLFMGFIVVIALFLLILIDIF